MAPKLYATGPAARQALLAGIDLVADLVAPTLGPRGRHAVLQRLDAPPLITNDGVTIARSLELVHDPMTNQGVQLVREVASTTEDFVGDGTTTASLLAQAMVRGAFRELGAGANGVTLSEGIERAVAGTVRWFEAHSRPADVPTDIERTAAVAARDAHVGGLVAEALRAVGPEGLVRIEDDVAYGVRLEVQRGMRFDRGLVSPALATDATGRETVFERPYVLLAAERLTEVRQLAPVLAAVAAERRPLVVIAEEIAGEALTLLILNVRRRGLPVAAVRAPHFGADRLAALEDIAVFTGGRVFGSALGSDLERAGIGGLGRVGRAVVTADATSLADGSGDAAAVERRAREIRAAIAYEDSEYERDKHRTRLARLAGALATVKVGLDSDTEQEETRHRIRDALNAGRAAMTHGVLPGGGAALVHAARALPTRAGGEDDAGARVVRTALEAPLRRLAANAGLDPSVAVRQVRDAPFGHGLDLLRGECCDLVATGILDPTRVVCAALETAASIARACLHSEAIIADRPLVIPRRPHHPHGHHHHGDPDGHTHHVVRHERSERQDAEPATAHR
jgi:chaperonin GroEL